MMKKTVRQRRKSDEKRESAESSEGTGAEIHGLFTGVHDPGAGDGGSGCRVSGVPVRLGSPLPPEMAGLRRGGLYVKEKYHVHLKEKSEVHDN